MYNDRRNRHRLCGKSDGFFAEQLGADVTVDVEEKDAVAESKRLTGEGFRLATHQEAVKVLFKPDL